MRVIGVIDLAGGRAVHAAGGRRDRYAPVRAVAGSAIEAGDALALARAYIDELGLRELYVADLDAIAGGPPQAAITGALTTLGVPVWIDAGVSSVDAARRVLERDVARAVVGLETLQSFDALFAICAAVDRERVAFSLDLRDGAPLTPAGYDGPKDEEPAEVAARAAEAGAGSVIVIDLARVGAGAGLDVEMMAAVRAAVPLVTLLAGGGVRGPEDLAQLARAGCDGALVATAFGLQSAG